MPSSLPHRTSRRTLLQAAKLGRRPPPLAWYVAAAGLLAMVATGALIAVDIGGRGAETAGPQASLDRPQAAQTHVAARQTPPAVVAPSGPVGPPSPPPPPPDHAAPAAIPPSPQPAPATAAPAADAAPADAEQPASAATASVPAAPAPADALRGKPPTASLGHWVVESPQAPMQCLPERIRTVLADLAQAVGEVQILATTDFQTDNHSPGSARAKMHAECRAVDLKVRGSVAEATAYLRARAEVAAVQSYRNGVIHLDFPSAERAAAAPAGDATRRRTRAARADAAASASPAEVGAIAAPAPPPSPFAPVARPDIVR